MDRTVPTRNSDEIALYLRTYYSLLRSTREVEIRTLTEAHTRINSALHVGARDEQPDMAAFIYAILRLPPAVLHDVRLVVLGQSEEVFREGGYPDVETWQKVGTPARRRRSFFDGQETLAFYIASRSDIDDVLPTLTALQIERDKLHYRLSTPPVLALLDSLEKEPLTDDGLEALAKVADIPADDLERVQRIWGNKTIYHLRKIGLSRRRFSVRLLSGSLADYRRATRRWWQNVARSAPEMGFEDRPVYFISSNTHSLANLVSGYGLREKKLLEKYVLEEGSSDVREEYQAIIDQNVPSSRENFLYYVLKKYESSYPEMTTQRLAHERMMGITRIPSQHVFDVEVQLMELSKIDPTLIDPRLALPGIELLRKSRAIIINIDFPLGMAAYQILSEVARNIASIRGIYIMGKAATLNGQIGDVMLPNVVHDDHTVNTYLFNNCFSADDVAPHLTYGTVMDNQKAITVRGTFLQNREYMSVFYNEGYTDMEMEAGPFLSSVYEMIRPQRHPMNELVNLHQAPFPIGFIHYASDTPFSKGKNLGSQNLSYFGMDATYASSLAILHAIIETEIRRHKAIS